MTSSGMETAESLILFCKENGRICPQPQLWNKLWDMLPAKQRVGLGWEPALPLILAAWWETPALSKQLRLVEHIKWAETKGCLEQIGTFLRNLPEKDWFHLGD